MRNKFHIVRIKPIIYFESAIPSKHHYFKEDLIHGKLCCVYLQPHKYCLGTANDYPADGRRGLFNRTAWFFPISSLPAYHETDIRQNLIKEPCARYGNTFSGDSFRTCI